MDSIKTTLFPDPLRSAIQKLLEPHGARLEAFEQAERPSCLLSLPEGTRRELENRTAYYDHNKITLPDGFEIFQMVDAEGWSTIRFAHQEKQP